MSRALFRGCCTGLILMLALVSPPPSAAKTADAASAASGPPALSPPQDGFPAARLNPTGREISFDVPFRSDGVYLGDITITVTPADEVLVDPASLKALLAPVLKPDALAALFGSPREMSASGRGITVVEKTSRASARAPALIHRATGLISGEEPGGQSQNAAKLERADAGPVPTAESEPAATTRVALAQIQARGLPIRYDADSGEIHAAPAIDQRPTRNLTLNHTPEMAPPETVQKPAKFSGYLNTRAAISYVAQAPHAQTGLEAPSFDFDAAIRAGGVVLETEASLDIREDGGSYGSSSGRHEFRRHGSRLVYDDSEDVVRYKAGDLYPGFASFQTSPDILGISAERSYAKLRPGNSIRPTSEESFRIERPSNVDIVVDEAVVRRIRLSPGNYNIRDLPLRPGANKVRLVVQEDTGFSRTLEFTMVSSHTLLAPGVDEWEFAAGVRSRPLEVRDDGSPSDAFASYSEPNYDFDEPLGTMFYRIGATPFMTIEAHAQAARNVAMAGGGFVAETAAGLFAMDFAASQHHEDGSGLAASAAYDVKWAAGAGRNGGRSMKLSAEYVSPGFASLSDYGSGRPHGVSLAALFTESLYWGATASLAASYRTSSFDDERDESWNVDISLAQQVWDGVNASVSVGYAQQDNLNYGSDCDCDFLDETGFRAFLRVSYRPDAKSLVSLSYDAGEKRTRASYTRSEGAGAGAWSISGDAAYGAEEHASDAALTAAYTGNRAEIAATHSSRVEGIAFTGGRFKPVSTDQRTTVRVESGMAFADGAFAIGRPVTGGFAIVEPHSALADKTVVAGTDSAEIARSDALGAALIPDISTYMPNHVSLEVEDLPLGYDLGSDGAHFFSPYKAGHKVTLGNAYSVTAMGTLLDREGKPLALIAGEAWEEGAPDGRRVELFTNRTGRFGAQGVAPGRWIIEMPSAGGPLRYALEVSEGTQGFFKAGTLRPLS